MNRARIGWVLTSYDEASRAEATALQPEFLFANHEKLPADKSPTRHATYRFLGKPDEGMQNLLMETLKKDPKWY